MGFRTWGHFAGALKIFALDVLLFVSIMDLGKTCVMLGINSVNVREGIYW